MKTLDITHAHIHGIHICFCSFITFVIVLRSSLCPISVCLLCVPPILPYFGGFSAAAGAAEEGVDAAAASSFPAAAPAPPFSPVLDTPVVFS